jgi:anion-transporting  ArsA/GET3 family ATPase
LIERRAPTGALASAIISNPLYVELTGRFVHAHEYIAIERVLELHEEGGFDLIVVDTPPALGALDLLDAPAKMAGFFGSRLLRWLTMPARSRLLGVASRPFALLADRILGTQFLGEITNFFALLEQMQAGFVERAERVTGLLGDPRSTFVVVTSPESAPAREAVALVAELQRRRLNCSMVVVNRVLSDSLSSAAELVVAHELATRSVELAGLLGGDAGEAEDSGRAAVLAEVGHSFEAWAERAHRERLVEEELAGLAPKSRRVRHLLSRVGHLEGLAQIAAQLYAPE